MKRQTLRLNKMNIYNDTRYYYYYCYYCYYYALPSREHRARHYDYYHYCY